MKADTKANIAAVSTIIVLVTIILVARFTLGHTEPFFLIAGALGAAILAVITFMYVRRSFNRRRRILETHYISQDHELRIEYSFLRKVAGVPTKFRFKELEVATDSFQTLVGRGASASVFKGILTDGTSVAVKRIEGEEKGEKTFRSEVAAIASVQHMNLVRLYGYCIVPGGSRFLVYDFISNGSLDKWIFPKRGDHRIRHHHHSHRNFLTWELRYQVAIDVARALRYLHHDCRSRILHLDVKPENILLDENYHAVVADFGLSRLMGKDESLLFSTVRGTQGYLAPEWLLENGISEKSDIFSFGMVILELIGGKRNVHLIDKGGQDRSKRRYQYFPKTVNEKRREGKIMEVVDPRMIEHGGVDEEEVARLVNIAMWCIQDKPRLRPTMVEVLDMLEGRFPIKEAPQSEMMIVDLLSFNDDDDQGHAGGVDGKRKQKVAGTLLTGDQVVSEIPTSTISPCPSFVISVVSAR